MWSVHIILLKPFSFYYLIRELFVGFDESEGNRKKSNPSSFVRLGRPCERVAFRQIPVWPSRSHRSSCFDNNILIYSIYFTTTTSHTNLPQIGRSHDLAVNVHRSGPVVDILSATVI